MRKEFKVAGIGLLAAAATGCAGEQQQAPPNIILVFADDIGKECFGCYSGVSYNTPNIDALAQRSVRYENMHSLPLSSPSRVQLMTGLYNDRNYVNFGYMNDDENTFAHLAQTAGYSTAMVGKWQLGRSRDMVSKLGFDEWCLNQLEMYKEGNGEKGTDRYANSYFDNNGHYEYSLYAPDDFQRYAFDYIDRNVAAGKPFMLYYSTPLVHTPHVATPDSECWDTDQTTRFKGDVSHFPDMVEYLDKQVGQLVRKLEQAGIWDNTILIFMSDNGTSTRIVSKMADGSEIRGGKGTPTVYGTNVPLLIAWGDKIGEGRVSERLVDLTDFMPTFADAMGVEIPAEWRADGISLYPELCGKAPLEREFTLMHFNPLWPTTPSPLASRCAYNTEYKYYWDGRFYNIKEDPRELNRVDIAACSEDVKALYGRLKARVDELADWYPNKPGAPRRGDYGTFYDFAGPQDPF
ncbi:sulfatase-like hydrolase/transferase [uncultured Alistipes sp.]|uniref:sulfatase-like hydrolase/transferase n=1 Tax=uncultured Alistipes sp. TaxID=538949 RepID=UPI0025FD5925|nr:sulfatase-like hydrolase/transferase [uncultured Alistipes sp.]